MDREIELEHHIIKQNHLLWKLRFYDHYQENSGSGLITKLTDSRQCECGRLLYGSHFFSIHSNICGIEELEKEHEKVHNIARELLKNGQKKEENINSLASSSKRFLDILDNVYQEIEKEIERKRLCKTG